MVKVLGPNKIEHNTKNFEKTHNILYRLYALYVCIIFFIKF